MLDLVMEYQDATLRQTAQNDFISFVRHVWPDFIEGAHHRVVASALNRVASGECKRLMVFMPPRHTKSEFASHLLPAWYLGKFPNRKIIQASNTAELAVGFGRRVRNLVKSERYAQIFPDTTLSPDSKAAGRWNTNHQGEYFAVGVAGRLAGRGADLLIIDDPHSEQEAAINSVNMYNTVYEWYKLGPRQRLQPGASIIIVVTRWSKIDLPGQILKRAVNDEGADEWEIIQLPAIVDEHTEDERSVWPGFWSLEELQATRATVDIQNWQSQYQQNPTSEEGALIKREWWKTWPHETTPKVEFVIQAWDTAFLAKETADFSACTTWGIWQDDDGVSQIILLDALQERLEFPDLKVRAQQLYKKYKPDAFIVEAKAAGIPLTFELRRMGIPVNEFKPNRGNDKIARVNAISDIFKSGLVWAPATRWAEEVIEQCAEFPHGDADDLVDTVSMALLRYRQGGFINLEIDETYEKKLPRRVAAYY